MMIPPVYSRGGRPARGSSMTGGGGGMVMLYSFANCSREVSGRSGSSFGCGGGGVASSRAGSVGASD